MLFRWEQFLSQLEPYRLFYYSWWLANHVVLMILLLTLYLSFHLTYCGLLFHRAGFKFMLRHTFLFSFDLLILILLFLCCIYDSLIHVPIPFRFFIDFVIRLNLVLSFIANVYRRLQKPILILINISILRLLYILTIVSHSCRRCN